MQSTQALSHPATHPSFGVWAENVYNETVQKIKDVVSSPVGQGVIGFGLGLGLYVIGNPLAEKITKALGVSTPFSDLDFAEKILAAPIMCVIAPIWEEVIFRGVLQDNLKDKLYYFYANHGLSDAHAKMAARVTSLFFGSIIFGLFHFTNALMFWCHPIHFLPQVIITIIAGVILGLAKEFSGDIYLPSGIHIGNNTLAWAHLVYSSF